jgi:hypothetical protein
METKECNAVRPHRDMRHTMPSINLEGVALKIINSVNDNKNKDEVSLLRIITKTLVDEYGDGYSNGYTDGYIARIKDAAYFKNKKSKLFEHDWEKELQYIDSLIGLSK